MSLLDSEARAGIQSALVGGDAPDPAPPATPTDSVVESAPSAPPQDVKPAETSDSESSPSASSSPPPDKKAKGKRDTGQKVPYGRFKNVVDARNHFKRQLDRTRSEIGSRDEQIAQLQRQMEVLSRTPIAAPQPVVSAKPEVKKESESSWLDDILGTSESENAPPESDRLAELQKGFQQRLSEQERSFDTRMHKYEVNQAQRQLESEIVTVRSRYPDLRPQDLAQLVINDPSVNLMEAAETFMTYKAAVEEQAVNRYLRENPHLTQQEKEQVVQAAAEVSAEQAGASETAPTAPPSPTGSRSSTTTGSEAAERPQDLKSVKYALRDYFKSNNPFAS